MKLGLNIYRTTYGTEMRYDDQSSILIEGRNELCKVLLALRKTEDEDIKKLSKQMWRLLTRFERCKHCGILGRCNEEHICKTCRIAEYREWEKKHLRFLKDKIL